MIYKKIYRDQFITIKNIFYDFTTMQNGPIIIPIIPEISLNRKQNKSNL
jgi:hypothetical protein